MDSKVYSMSELRDLCRSWAEEIKEEYMPDFIIFIAKSGYIIADEFSKTMGVPMDEIHASRAGGRLRKIAAPFFHLLPLTVRNRIVGAKCMYKFNDKKNKRNVYVPERLNEIAKKMQYKKILIIDDSIDTGWTFVEVYNKIRQLFCYADIRTLALIKMTYCERRFNVDYNYFENMLLLTPAQVDSGEYYDFISQYETWCKEKRESFY